MIGSGKNHNTGRIIIGILLLLFFFGFNYYYVVYKPESRTIPRDTKKDTSITFGWWGNDDRHLYTLTGIDLFEEKYPDIEVNCSYNVWNGYERRNRIYMLSEKAPDVMQINYNWIRQYSADGSGYYDLNKLSDYIDLDSYSEKDLSYGTSNGVLNAVPIAYNAVVFYYNQDILDQYGLKVPETWDDLFTAASVMNKDGRYPLHLSDKHLFLSVLAHYEQTSGQTLFDEDETYTGGTGAAGELLKFYKELFDRQVICLDGKSTDTDFSSGTCAGVGIWASDAENYCGQLQEQDKNASPVLAAPPCTSDHDALFGWYVKPATMYAISRNTKHPKESAELLNFLVNDRDMVLLQGTEKGIPVSAQARSILEKHDALNSRDAEAGNYVFRNLDHFETMVPSNENSDIIDAFCDEAAKYVYGVADLNTCSKELVDRWNATIHSLKTGS
ncbi:MAG: ABC transporter substrate-binding protein [Bilifractor sp.]|jgi:oligogalacturonide transport system substrate-binding protein